VTAGTEGAIFIWNTPESVLRSRKDEDMPERVAGIDTMATGGPAPANAPKRK